MNNNASDLNEIDKVEEPSADVTIEQVADFLRHHPDFFSTHSELLTELQMIQEKQGTVSLTQIQLEQYRTKVKTQRKQLENFIENARRNEMLYMAYADLNFAISKCGSFAELEMLLQGSLCDTLGMKSAKLIIIDSRHMTIPDLPQHSLLHKKLAKRQYYFGRLSKHEKDALFKEIDVGSVALIKIENAGTTAILAIASEDPAHFEPDMDTRLLDYLRQYLVFHLPRILSD